MVQTEDKPHILVGVCAGIAGYKAIEVVRCLQKAGASCRVCMTCDAKQFVGPLTFEALTGYPVACNLFDDAKSSIPHITLSKWADAIVIVPATANTLARLAWGMADDVLCATVLAATCPKVLAHSMNVHMLENPATQENLATLRRRGFTCLESDEGRLACGDTGKGKLPEPARIADAALMKALQHKNGEPWAGKRVVITLGATEEPIDPVRYLTNGSSGKMGVALAKAARNAGASVQLVAGRISTDLPYGVQTVPARTSQQMHDAAVDLARHADIAICVAAVSDIRPETVAADKIKKADLLDTGIAWQENQDILSDIAHLPEGERPQVVVGFAAETRQVEAYGKAKLECKGCDMIIANDVSQPTSTFGSDTNQVTCIARDFSQEISCKDKQAVAEDIINLIQQKFL